MLRHTMDHTIKSAMRRNEIRSRHRQTSGAAALVILATLSLPWGGGTLVAQVKPAYLYTLSDFSGPIRYEWVRVAVDERREETYVIFQNLIRVFGSSGMEIYSFGDDLDLGHILDAAVDEQGDIFLLSYKDSRSLVTRCNFRGEPVARLNIRGLPDDVAFHANRMIRRNGRFYFASLPDSRVIITGGDGAFERHIDVLPLVEGEAKEKDQAEIIGFAVDLEGNIYVTVPAMFRVCKISPEGTLSSFGRPGSAPGRFGILAGVAVDSRGNLLVADKLKCVVMVFDRTFRFMTEFGYRGAKAENLVVPDSLAVDGKDRVYVSQGRRRGVSVYALKR
jgi:hypothetical protein